MKRWMVGVALLFAACGDPRCTAKPEPSLCEALIDGYYFDAKPGHCASFVWGGCGVRPPFSSFTECVAVCE